MSRRKLGECTLENQTLKTAKTDAFVNVAIAGDLRAVNERLRLGQDVNLFHSTLDLTALHGAVDSGHFDVVTSLIKHGAAVNLPRQVGYYYDVTRKVASPCESLLWWHPRGAEKK